MGGSPSSNRLSAPYTDWLWASAGGPTRPASKRPWVQYDAAGPGSTAKPSATVAAKAATARACRTAPPDQDKKHYEQEWRQLHAGRDAYEDAGPASFRPHQVDEHRQHQQHVHLTEGQVLPDRLQGDRSGGQERHQPSRRGSTERSPRHHDHRRQRADRRRGPQRRRQPHREQRQRHHHHGRERRVREGIPGHRVVGLVEGEAVQDRPAAVPVDEQVREAAMETADDGSDDHQRHDRRESAQQAGAIHRWSRTSQSQWLRSAFISSDLFIFDRPSIPISPARLRSSSTVQSS